MMVLKPVEVGVYVMQPILNLEDFGAPEFTIIFLIIMVTFFKKVGPMAGLR